MLSGDLAVLLIQVIKSWQVLVVTGAIILYVFLVNYASRTYHRPRVSVRTRPKKVKAKPAPVAKPKETAGEDNSNESLGLEEN